MNLDKVVAALKKKYMTVDIASSIPDPTDFISTGNMAFDLILDGGIPFGYFAEFLGFSQSGKCVSGNTKIFLKGKGLVRIDSICQNSQPNTWSNIEEDILSSDQLRKSNHFYFGGEVCTKIVNTNRGFSIEADPTHKIKVLDKNNTFIFKSITELSEKDVICIAKNYNTTIFNNSIPSIDLNIDGYNSIKYNLPKEMSNELAELMGYIVANGNSTIINSISISSEDDYVRNRILFLGKFLFNTEFSVMPTTIEICSKQIKEFLISLGCSGVLSSYKKIPNILWLGKKEFLLNFLAAYFICDGYVDQKGRIELCSASKEFIDDLSFFLWGEGIVHRKKEKLSFARNSKTPREKIYYHIYIECTSFSIQLMKVLNLYNKYKNRLDYYKGVDRQYIVCNSAIIKNIFAVIKALEGGTFKYKFSKGCGYQSYLGKDLFKLLFNARWGKSKKISIDTLKKLYTRLVEKSFPNKEILMILKEITDEHIYLDTITSVQNSISKVYDISVPETKQYVANNIIVHNSLFVQQLIANAQKKYNAIGVLVDRENAYTNKRGEQLQINNDNLILVKSADIPTLTDAFVFIVDILKTIREKDRDSYIVVGLDSLSAFGKDTLLEKSDQGRKAKAAHEGLRELLTYTDSKIAFLITNQFTYKIGVLYGDPRTSTAGEASKYYCNIRIALEDRHKIVDPMSEEVLGNWIGVEVIKTRLGPCYRDIYLPHFYSTGIDYYGGYTRLLVDRGYLYPKNKSEFKAFKQKTVLYIKDTIKEQINEFEIEKFLEKHPELLFSTYPEFNKTDKKEIKEEDEE